MSIRKFSEETLERPPEEVFKIICKLGELTLMSLMARPLTNVINRRRILWISIQSVT